MALQAFKGNKTVSQEVRILQVEEFCPGDTRIPRPERFTSATKQTQMALRVKISVLQFRSESAFKSCD
jgi:hypothetical protein